MPYRELQAPRALARHVACVWWRTGPSDRVLPDGCVDIVWTGRRLLVAGPATRAVAPDVDPDEVTLGVRFRVGSAGIALGFPASELLDHSARADDVWGKSGTRLEQLVADQPGPQRRLETLTQFAGLRLSEAHTEDPLVRAAVLELTWPKPRVAELCGRLGISERQLRRRFAGAVGYSPRTLGRVLRFQRFLAVAANRNPSGDGNGLARVAAEAGYADQAHLTRECRDLAGVPPAALLASGAGAAGERTLHDSRTPPSGVSAQNGL
jgi:AraC-like DNA-binding protein